MKPFTSISLFISFLFCSLAIMAGELVVIEAQTNSSALQERPQKKITTDSFQSALQLSTSYKHIDNINNYLISEKLDGVRGVWTGEELMTRGGLAISVPDWFISGFPDYSLDGELWIGRGQFEQVSALVRTKENTEAWRNVRFMVFDLPKQGGTFESRYRYMLMNLQQHSEYIEVIPQIELSSMGALDDELSKVIKLGGEGLMLHRKLALYRQGRSQDLIKLKPFYDDEATVIGYKPGKGKFSGMMGSLMVETEKGVRFSLGTGFTLAQRKSPPKLGSIVTYKYFGFTQKGTPRFASFLRVRFPPKQEQSP